MILPVYDLGEPPPASTLDPFSAGRILIWAFLCETLVLILSYSLGAVMFADAEDWVLEIIFIVIGYVVVIYMLSRASVKRGLHPTEVFRLKKVEIKDAFSLVLLGAGLISVELLVINVLDFFLKGKIGQWAALFPSAELEGSLVPAAILLVVIVPLVEEMVFRGFLSKAFSGWGPGWAVVFPGIVFALFHHPVGMVGAFCIALICGIMALNYDSIIPGIFVHAGCNFMVVLIEFIMTFVSSSASVAVLICITIAGSVSLIFLRSKLADLWHDLKRYWLQFKEKPAFRENLGSLARNWAWMVIFAGLLVRIGQIVYVTVRGA